MMRFRRPIVLALAVSGAALLAAGCGGGGGSPGVASLSSTSADAPTTSTTQGDAGSGGSGGSGLGGPSGGHFQLAMKMPSATLGAKFSACMRKHGVTSFPDPNGQGVITFGSGTGIDPNSPTFRSAQSTCRKLLPNGGRPTPQQQAKMQQQLLAFAKCMRSHGIQDFPDPSNGGLRIQVHPGSDLDPQNPQFQAAQKACRGLMPLAKGGGGPSAGGRGSAKAGG